VIHQVVRRLFHRDTLPASEKVVILFEAHTEILRRGKAPRGTPSSAIRSITPKSSRGVDPQPEGTFFLADPDYVPVRRQWPLPRISLSRCHSTGWRRCRQTAGGMIAISQASKLRVA
jgi:hypothetical protein